MENKARDGDLLNQPEITLSEIISHMIKSTETSVLYDIDSILEGTEDYPDTFHDYLKSSIMELITQKINLLSEHELQIDEMDINKVAEDIKTRFQAMGTKIRHTLEAIVLEVSQHNPRTRLYLAPIDFGEPTGQVASRIQQIRIFIKTQVQGEAGWVKSLNTRLTTLLNTYIAERKALLTDAHTTWSTFNYRFIPQDAPEEELICTARADNLWSRLQQESRSATDITTYQEGKYQSRAEVQHSLNISVKISHLNLFARVPDSVEKITPSNQHLKDLELHYKAKSQL